MLNWRKLFTYVVATVASMYEEPQRIMNTLKCTQTRLVYVETHDRQWIISSITVHSHDFLVVCGPYIKLMKTLFHLARHSKQTTEEVYLKGT